MRRDGGAGTKTRRQSWNETVEPGRDSSSSASRCRPWRFAARRLGVALGDSPLGVSVLPSAFCRLASWCCPQRFAARRLSFALGNSPLGVSVLPSASCLCVSPLNFCRQWLKVAFLEGKTLTEVCRRQWWNEQQWDVILLHPCFVSLTLLFHHPLFLILCDTVVFVRNQSFCGI